ncbi:hypothetical protein LCGC14_2710580 [marine sediment metagenome]|uniref:Uncharacterized protein n=1 Tax=marine sediment metagenome TaxID=412755 RepID=A0A0F8ZD31_9ZZZZ
MSDTVNTMWFKMGDDVTHLCGGHTEKKRMNKPKGTQTPATDWFNPATLEDDVYTCVACGESAKTNDGAVFTNIGEENG